ncbi:hypothetical protein OIV83_003791 [Microbotryomycetes sp. JL201]|nr:hypothetical protein OIV83_003791 [Microbotryomycetes sp. JL201]
MPSLTLATRQQSFAPAHYDSTPSAINNLTFALHGTGRNGQLYQPDQVSDKQYGTYNYCNMPHVRVKEYKQPKGAFTLQYVEVIHRHHKRTPYGSNTFPREDITWDCSDALTTHGSAATSAPVTPIAWNGVVDPVNPMTALSSPGFVGSNCQFPQITAGGALDSYQHGKDLAEVYQKKLKFLPKKLDNKFVSFRVTNNVITSQVASALVPGLFPDVAKNGAVAANIQSSNYDSLEPTYSCPAADQARSANEGSNANWTASLSGASDLFARLDAVSGVDPSDGGWHSSIDHYRFRSSAQATTYATLRHAAWVMELRSHLDKKMSGDQMLYRHNVAHDGSMSALLGLLQIDEMVWPGMGAEIVFELYQQNVAKGKKGDWFLRVLWGGQPMKTATPLGTLAMVPISKFYAYLDQQLPKDLRATCFA